MSAKPLEMQVLNFKITENLAYIQQQIREIEKQYCRPTNSVALLAVSKGQSIEKIIAAYEAGQHAFGESYLQEAINKIFLLKDKNIEWHFIGFIQSNKTRKIAELFTWVHSIDSKKIAKRLHEQRPTNLSPLNICIQVNLDGEPNKAGVSEAALLPLIEYCYTLSQLRVRGLMCIPTPHKTFAAQRQTFHRINLLFKKLQAQGLTLDTLSIGMSEDFVAAIAEGSTLVRIGQAIFGPRSIR